MREPKIDATYAHQVANDIRNMDEIELGRFLSGGYGVQRRNEMTKKIQAMAIFISQSNTQQNV